MKLLLLTKKFPYPLTDGESVAVHNMVIEFKKLGVVVDILSFNTTKHYTDISRYKEDLGCYDNIFTVDLDNSINKIEALKNLFTKKSFHIQRFENEDYSNQLKMILNLKDYDVIQMESVFLAPYIKDINQITDVPIVLRTHNIEYRIWDRIADSEKGIKKLYLKEQVKRLTKYEQHVWNAVDCIIAMSSVDGKEINSHSVNSTDVIPISLNKERYQNTQVSINELSFIGSLDWMPNTEGIDWLIDEVWNSVLALKPNARLNIAGKNAPDRYQNIDLDGINFVGKVPNAIEFIDKYNIMVVPLKSGSGIRVKILEAMALGKVVISTAIGIEGIKAVAGQDYLLADTAEDFAKAIAKVIDNEDLQAQLSKNSRAVFDKYYSNKLNGKRFLNIYKTLI